MVASLSMARSVGSTYLAKESVTPSRGLPTELDLVSHSDPGLG